MGRRGGEGGDGDVCVCCFVMTRGLVRIMVRHVSSRCET